MMIWAHIGLFVICLISSAFFAASETALMSVSLSTWDQLRRDRPRIGAAYRLWSENPSLLIATLLLGNTLASLGASVVAGSLADRLVFVHPVPRALVIFV